MLYVAVPRINLLAGRTSALASLVYMASPTFHNAMALQHSLRLLISALLTLVAVFVQGMRCWIGAPEEQDVGSTMCWFGGALLMAMQKRVRQMLSVAVEIVMEVLAQHKKVKSIQLCGVNFNRVM